MEQHWITVEELDDYLKKYGEKIKFMFRVKSDQSGTASFRYLLIIAE